MDDRILKIATRAKVTLEALSEKITNSQIEFDAEKYEELLQSGYNFEI